MTRFAVILLVFLVAGCATTRSPPQHEAVAADVATRVSGAPALPAADDPWLDADFFAEPLTLERAVAARFANDPAIRAELTRLDTAAAQRWQAGLLMNPMLSAMAMRPEGGGRWRLELGLMQSLVDLVQRPRRVDAAEAAEARVAAEVLARLLDAAREAETAWVDALLAQDVVALRREDLDLLETQARLDRSRADSGAAPRERALSAAASVDDASLALQHAEHAAREARARLAAVLGMASAEPLRLPEALPEPAQLDWPEDFPTDQLLAAHPRLRAAEAAQDEADRRLALADTWPGIGEARVGPTAMREPGGTAMAGLGLDIALPLFDDGRAAIAMSQAESERARFEREAIERRLKLDVETALAQLLIAERTHARHDAELARRQQLATLAASRHRAGLAPFEERTTTDRAVLRARVSRLEHRAELWRYLIDLERASGMVVVASAGAKE